MRATRKIIGVLLALMLVFGMSSSVFAADTTISVAEGDTRTYEVYQIFKGDVNGTTLSNVVWGANGNGTVDEAVPKATIDKLISDVNGAAGEAAKAIQIATMVKPSTSPIATLTGGQQATVPTGYYLIKDVTPNLAEGESYSIHVVEVVGAITISPKTAKVTAEKKVKDVNDSTNETTDWQDSADYDIGDDVPFQLTATLNGDVDKFTKYEMTFHDTLSKGLDYNEDAVVKINGTAVQGFAINYSKAENGETTLTISCDNVKALGAQSGSVITVEYTAELTEGANIGSAGNDNTMYLEYTNNPNNNGTGTTTPDIVTVFTYETIVDKVDGQNNPLAGATFELEKKVNGGWESVGVAEAKAIVEDETTVYRANFKGLDDGEYRLVEKVTPAGYNTAEPVVFKIEATHSEKADNPVLISLSSTNNKVTAEKDAGLFATTVVNNSGSTLPETGGMGTTILYLIGGLLILGAAGALVYRRRTAA